VAKATLDSVERFSRFVRLQKLGRLLAIDSAWQVPAYARLVRHGSLRFTR